jgi:hypothetical protein
LVRGIVLAMRFSGHSSLSFDTVIIICQDSNSRLAILRLVHSTGASFLLFSFLPAHWYVVCTMVRMFSLSCGILEHSVYLSLLWELPFLGMCYPEDRYLEVQLSLLISLSIPFRSHFGRVSLRRICCF